MTVPVPPSTTTVPPPRSVRMGAEEPPIRAEVMSFGFKRGLPRQADLVMDVRFLPNPFYIEELCHHSGLDEDVRTYVLDNDVSREFLEKEQDLNFLKSQERELQEAITAGTAALRVANDVVLSLKHVEGLGMFERLGTSFLTDMAKREVLDDAQKNVEQLQIQLQSFNKELSDVKFRDNLGAGMGRLLRFTDSYFENLLTVESPAERMKESIRQVDETRDLILGMLRQLQSRLEEVRHRQMTTHNELNQLIVATEL